MMVSNIQSLFIKLIERLLLKVHVEQVVLHLLLLGLYEWLDALHSFRICIGLELYGSLIVFWVFLTLISITKDLLNITKFQCRKLVMVVFKILNDFLDLYICIIKLGLQKEYLLQFFLLLLFFDEKLHLLLGRLILNQMILRQILCYLRRLFLIMSNHLLKRFFLHLCMFHILSIFLDHLFTVVALYLFSLVLLWLFFGFLQILVKRRTRLLLRFCVWREFLDGTLFEFFLQNFLVTLTELNFFCFLLIFLFIILAFNLWQLFFTTIKLFDGLLLELFLDFV